MAGMAGHFAIIGYTRCQYYKIKQIELKNYLGTGMLLCYDRKWLSFVNSQTQYSLENSFDGVVRHWRNFAL
jgi:hypothetical protein